MFKIFNKKQNCNNKIIFICPDINSGGAENIIFNLAKAISKNDILLISLTDIGYYGSILRKEGYKIYSLNMKKNIFVFFKIFYLLILIIRFKPRIIQTWLYHANLVGGIAAKLLGVKKIYWTVHHDFEYRNLYMMLEMRILVLLSYLIPDKIIYGSNPVKNNHVSNGYFREKSIVINNGVSTSKFRPVPELRDSIRKDLNITKKCLLLGNIARYIPLKDHETLLKSLKILKSKGLNFKCLLIGQGLSNENREFKIRIKKYGLEDKVILYGKTYEINNILNAFDINILTSKKECSPISLIESMSTGIPCISTNVGDAIELIGDSGWVVNTSDYKSIAKLIMDINLDKKILKIKSNIARKRVEKNYPIEKMIYKYKKLYR
tara:strand:+ start:933 stop:2066 length:1134 start_codon:yes stop_codon:yes gene_type:complete